MIYSSNPIKNIYSSGFINPVGERFGRLIVTSYAFKTNSGAHKFNAICDCGNQTLVLSGNLRKKKNATVSCGCHKKEVHSKESPVYNTVEYKAWLALKGRCLNKNNNAYSNYGGRGIKVFDGWVNNFYAFLKHIGKKPGNKYSIDRINNNGNYEPGNVRWATMDIQLKNKRNVTLYFYDGISESLDFWGKKIGLSRSAIGKYIKRFSISEIIENPKECAFAVSGNMSRLKLIKNVKK